MMGSLPLWMDGANAQAFKSLMNQWWGKVGVWADFGSTSFDVLTCALEFVDLIAFQRGIDRYAGEAEGFYRLRVHHALRNARAAGTPAGMTKVFENLQFPKPEFIERLPQYDWDMTKVRIPSRDYADATLREQIHFTLSAYWQTCRRFIVAQRTDAENSLDVGNTLTTRSQAQRDADLLMISARPVNTSLIVGNQSSTRTHNKRALSPQPPAARVSSNTSRIGNVVSHRTHVPRSIQLKTLADSSSVNEFGYFKAGNTFGGRNHSQRIVELNLQFAISRSSGDIIGANSFTARQRTIRRFTA